MQSTSHNFHNMFSKGLSDNEIENILNKKLISNSKNISKRDKKMKSNIDNKISDSNNTVPEKGVTHKENKLKKKKKDVEPNSYSEGSIKEETPSECELNKIMKKVKNSILNNKFNSSSSDSDEKSISDVKYEPVKNKNYSSSESSEDEPYNIQSEHSVKEEVPNSESSSDGENRNETSHRSTKSLEKLTSGENEDSFKNKLSKTNYVNKSDRKSLDKQELLVTKKSSKNNKNDTNDSGRRKKHGKRASDIDENEGNIQKTSSGEYSDEADQVDNYLQSNSKSKQISQGYPKMSKKNVRVIQNIELTPSKVNIIKEKIQEICPDAKPLKLIKNLEISNSEEVYLFSMPKNVDPHLLQNASIELDSKCKINIGKKYILRPSNKTPDPSLIVSDNCRIVQFKGCINMVKHIKTKKVLNIEVPEKLPIPLPVNLKECHPLFGSDFKDKINLSEYAKRKIDDAIAIKLKHENKKHKKKKDKSKQESREGEEVIFDLLNTHTAEKPKKIKKEVTDDSEFSSFSGSMHENKKKKIKINSNNADTMQMVKSEVFTDSERKDSTYNKSKLETNKRKYNGEAEDVTHKKKHKKTKHDKIEQSKSVGPRDNFEFSAINSTLRRDILKTPHFNPEVSDITSESPRSYKKANKLKRKLESEQEASKGECSSVSDVLDALGSDLSTRKKKKKKHKKDSD